MTCLFSGVVCCEWLLNLRKGSVGFAQLLSTFVSHSPSVLYTTPKKINHIVAVGEVFGLILLSLVVECIYIYVIVMV